MFCEYCGAEVYPNADVCLKCGKIINKGQFKKFSESDAVVRKENLSNKKRMTAGFLALFLGWFGVHNFYVGKVGLGLVQLILTCTIALNLIFLKWFSLNISGDKIFFEYATIWFFMYILLTTMFLWVLIDVICCFAGSYRDVENKKLS